MAKRAVATMPSSEEIKTTDLAEALGERYLAYALSTIVARSLPDVRDGLKPVHRRILYTMRQLRLDPNSGFKKSARVVGDVMGKFHPHGDSAIYEAMARLAQDFAQRYPMVEGQGNFGSLDGDNPAAMRYTEARLSPAAILMLTAIDEGTVDFRPSYDGEGQEPTVLPAAFPNLLANGAQGIAVGMATSIPPHNVAEICDGLLHLLKHPEARLETLIGFIPGPDFPTGGDLVEDPATIAAAYGSGRGSFRLRAHWQAENLRGGLYRIVVTEIPYQVAKSKLIEQIATLLGEKKLSLLEDIADESAEDVRIVLTPKSRNIPPEHLMEQLFRQTDLEQRVSINMNVLDRNQTPRVMSLRDVLMAYLEHRREVLQRRSRFRLAEILHRLEILDGYLVVYRHLDEVIRIIRFEDEPKAVMMRRWKLSEIQVDAVLNMKLKALRKLEESDIRDEHKALIGERKELEELLASPAAQSRRLAIEIGEIKKTYGRETPLGRRRTRLVAAPAIEIAPIEAMVEREPITIVCSAKGWIRALKGHVEPEADIKFKEGDRGKFHIQAETTDKLLVFATNGKMFTLPADRLPGGRGHGEPIRLYLDLGNEHDILAMLIYRPGLRLLVAAHDGRGFLVKADEILAQTKNGKQVLGLPDGIEAAVCVPAEGDRVAIIGDNRKLLLFPLDEIPEMTRGRGVILQKYKEGGLADAKVFAAKTGLSWRLGDKIRTESAAALKDWLGTRAQAGRLPPTGFPKSNKFA